MKQAAIFTILIATGSAAIAAPPAAPIEPLPPEIKISREAKNKLLVEIARQHAEAVRLDENNGKQHLLLADTLMELTLHAKDIAPLMARVEVPANLGDERKQEIVSTVNALCTHYDGVRAMVWLVEQGDAAEPFVVERLNKARDYEKPRLYEVLTTHWKNLAIEHYAKAHNLSWKQDIASYNPAFGEPWDKFTALRAGKAYLQLTAWRTDEASKQQAEQIRATFATLRQKQSDYKGPVR